LANSIRAQGVIQPIVVRQLEEQSFEIIAGERRWRACQLVRLETVPCIIKNVADNAAVAIALIENIQREDLNAIEEAAALLRLMQEFELTHQEVAEAVGKSRSAVSNLLRLNQLNDDVKRLVEHGDLDMGHARALLGLEGALQTELARQVAQKGMTVRDTEKMVQRLLAPREEQPAVEPQPLLASWESRVSERLGIPAKFVSSGKEKGKLVISFQNQADLDKILRYFEVS
jgi:ParB family chromosome partitioning protein